MQLIIYGHQDCHLCDRLEQLIQPHLHSLQQRGIDCQLIKRDIHDNEHWLNLYKLRIPVLTIDGREILEGKP